MSIINLQGQELSTYPEKIIGEDILEAERKALLWLKGQIVPNDIVPNPYPNRRRLIVSYLVQPDDPAYPYIHSRSFTYDNALGIIALTMAGEYRKAEYIIGALKRIMREDGSFWFTYNTKNSWPNEDDHEGAMIRTGAIAWVGYALTFYLNTRIRENENFLKEDLLAKDFLEMAESIARFVLRHQVKDPKDKRHGLVSGGWASYDLKLPAEIQKPVEEYMESEISWVSMEHNIDIYFFLRDLYRLTGKGEYEHAALLVKRGLLNLWSDEKGQFLRGIKGNQVIDTALPLDGASWASLFLFSIDEDRMARECLATIQNNFTSEFEGLRGYKPYYAETVYKDEKVNTYYFPKNPEMRWEDLNMIWIEGSLGVATAYIKAGNWRKGLETIKSLTSLHVDGGFRYSTMNIPYQFSNNPSVASTAWFVIAVEILKDEDLNKAFWGK